MSDDKYDFIKEFFSLSLINFLICSLYFPLFSPTIINWLTIGNSLMILIIYYFLYLFVYLQKNLLNKDF